MNKRMIKIMSAILMVLMIITVASPVFAVTPANITGGDNGVASNTIVLVGNSFVSVLRTVGIVLSVIVLMVIGVKYMLGSAEEKSDYKKSLLPYVIGAVLVFAASAFAQVIFEFVTKIGGGQ